jgi:hypothetical protein
MTQSSIQMMCYKAAAACAIITLWLRMLTLGPKQHVFLQHGSYMRCYRKQLAAWAV